MSNSYAVNEVYIVSEIRTYKDHNGSEITHVLRKILGALSTLELAESYIWDYVNCGRDYGDESKLICEICIRDSDVRNYYKDNINNEEMYEVRRLEIDQES